MTNEVTNMTDEVTNMTEKIRFKAVTGSCRFCGSNQYHFDEKEQTFVCEYCGAEVYISEEEPEEEVEEEVEEEETTHSNRNRYFSALFLLVVGGALTFAPMLIEQYGLLENINLPEGGQMQITGTEQMIEMLSTIFPIIGCMMVILAVCKVVTALLNPYRYC